MAVMLAADRWSRRLLDRKDAAQSGLTGFTKYEHRDRRSRPAAGFSFGLTGLKSGSLADVTQSGTLQKPAEPGCCCWSIKSSTVFMAQA